MKALVNLFSGNRAQHGADAPRQKTKLEKDAEAAIAAMLNNSDLKEVNFLFLPSPGIEDAALENLAQRFSKLFKFNYVEPTIAMGKDLWDAYQALRMLVDELELSMYMDTATALKFVQSKIELLTATCQAITSLENQERPVRVFTQSPAEMKYMWILFLLAGRVDEATLTVLTSAAHLRWHMFNKMASASRSVWIYLRLSDAAFEHRFGENSTFNATTPAARRAHLIEHRKFMDAFVECAEFGAKRHVITIEIHSDIIRDKEAVLQNDIAILCADFVRLILEEDLWNTQPDPNKMATLRNSHHYKRAAGKSKHNPAAERDGPVSIYAHKHKAVSTISRSKSAAAAAASTLPLSSSASSTSMIGITSSGSSSSSGGGVGRSRMNGTSSLRHAVPGMRPSQQDPRRRNSVTIDPSHAPSFAPHDSPRPDSPVLQTTPSPSLIRRNSGSAIGVQRPGAMPIYPGVVEKP